MGLYDKVFDIEKYLKEEEQRKNKERLKDPIDEYQFFKKLKEDGVSDEVLELKKKEFEEEVNKRKAWCERYTAYRALYDMYVNEIELYRTKEKQLTKYLTGMPSGKGGVKRPDDYWVDVMEKLDMLSQYMNDLSDRLLCSCVEISSAINRLEDSECAQVLTMRYIEGKMPKQISEEINMTIRKVFRLIRKGVLSLDFKKVNIKPPDLRYPSDYYFHYKGVNINDLKDEEIYDTGCDIKNNSDKLIRDNRTRLEFVDLD